MSSKYAYVWCVFGGEKYLNGAIPSAFSLNTQYDKVLMYTDDVSFDKDILKNVFNVFFKIDYIQIPSKKMTTEKQEEIYGDWIDRSYTKWNCLLLTQYTKVIFVDSDFIFLNPPPKHSHPDTLFKLTAPSGTFSTPWSKNFMKNGGIDISMYPSIHTSIVRKEIIDSAVKFKNSVAVIGTMILLEPSEEDFRDYLSYIKRNIPFGFKGCHSGFDEQSITIFYTEVKKKDWVFIHQRYNYIPWKTNWLEPGDKPVVYHYFNKQKPWDTKRDEYEDLKVYFDTVDKLLEKYPLIKSYITLGKNDF